MESSKVSPPLESSKKDEVGLERGELSKDLQREDLKVGVDEDLDKVSNKAGEQFDHGQKDAATESTQDVEGEKIPASSPVKPWETPGYCRKCHDRLTFEEDGRGGMWFGHDGSVWTDGTGLCIDCELDGSVETGQSSDEEEYSSCEEVTSSTPTKKKNQ